MTVVQTAAEVSFVANGATTAFPTTIEANDADDIVVVFRDMSTGADDVRSDYSLTNVGTASGVTVTFSTAPTNGTVIVIYREVSYTQTLDLQNQRGYDVRSLADGLDLMVMQTQQVKAMGDRTLRGPVGEPIAALPPAEMRVGKYFAFDGNGDPLLVTTIAENVATLGDEAAFYVSSVAAMQAIPKAVLTGGQAAFVGSYVAGQGEGGGLFLWDSVSAATEDSGTIFASAEGGAGRWLRQNITNMTLAQFGGVSGAADSTDALFAALNAFVANPDILGLDVSGLWNVDGGWPQISCSDKKISAAGYCMFTRLSNGKMLHITGDRNDISGLRFDGGTFTGTIYTDAGDNNLVTFARAKNGTDAGFNASGTSQYSTMAFCYAEDTGGTGFGMGGGTYPTLAFSSTFRAGPEGIQGNDLLYGRLIGNLSVDSGGVGCIAGNDASSSIIALNLTSGGNHGIGFGQKGIDGTRDMAILGNVLLDSAGYGLRMRNYYRKWNITGITQASPAVITFARIDITNITQANPGIVTAPSHGLVTGQKTQIHGVNGMTEVNGGLYEVYVIDANTLGLFEAESDVPLNTSTFTAYTSGGKLDHPFEVDKGWIYLRSVGGMTQINDLELKVGDTTVTTVTVHNQDGTDFDSSGFSAYTSGGYGESGSSTYRMAALGNVSNGNTGGSASIGSGAPIRTSANNVVIGNSFNEATEFYAEQSDSSVQNRTVAFDAALSANVTDVTGNGALYTMLPAQLADTAGGYDPATGIFTTPRAGWYTFTAVVQATQASSATAAVLALNAVDAFGVTRKNVTVQMQPKLGDVTNTDWFGINQAVMFLPAAAKVKVTVQISGLAGNTADLVSGSSFSGYCLG